MRTLTIPMSGQLLVAHLAAYGLGFALDVAGEAAFVGHDPSLEMRLHVSTTADLERIAECVRNAAAECEATVWANLPVPKKTLEWPVIGARATDMERARVALPAREELLDQLEGSSARAAPGLLAGLGAPAAWLHTKPPKPQWGASGLDGVPGNSTSDFVRGVLRHALPAAASITADELHGLWMVQEPPSPTDEDKTGWVPRGNRVQLLHQWLAALGLSLLPVGLSAHGRSRTPSHWRERRGVTLPVLAAPVSMPRLRALLQLPELGAPVPDPAAAGRLRALGIRELARFAVLTGSNDKMVAFSFARATRLDLRPLRPIEL